MSIFRPKNGQYYYMPHRGNWRIYQHEVYEDGRTGSRYIKDCMCKADAAEEVRKLNNW